MIKIKRGLDLPIAGIPEQRIEDAPSVSRVALIGFDYHGMKPSMAVQVGDRVKLGQMLFTDKKNPGVNHTAPAAGTVAAIHRGERRVFQSIVINVDGDEQLIFADYPQSRLASLGTDEIHRNLLESGLWTAFRTRPFSNVPAPQSTPHSIFVNAMDSHPLSGNPLPVIGEHPEAFRDGLQVLARLAKVFLCKAANVTLPGEELPNVQAESFSGPHPAGLPGTHIHFLDPVGTGKTVWTVNYQDVIAIGKLFTSGRIWTERVIALGGPVVEKPRLLRTRLGADLTELAAGQLSRGNSRLISGSVFGGRTARGAYAYLGRYHLQLSCLHEGDEREFLHYMRAGFDKFSVMNVFVSRLLGKKRFAFSTSTNGSARAMVPVGNYETVMPLDILPTQLLRALIMGDTELAQKLGALELDEEDLALCSYVCAGKYEYGPILRDNLTRIEQEG